MIRKIIKIDEIKCNGCGACASACHEGAIEIINGIAKLTREDYCDGLGDCLPACPTGAISFEEREAPAYDEMAVKNAKIAKSGCVVPATFIEDGESKLSQWPVQIKLIPPKAPFFEDANLLIAADCCAYAFGDFHKRFMNQHITLIGCPKLDAVDYSEKLTKILSSNNIRSITVVRMEVPCCGGIEYATIRAIQASGKNIPFRVVTISTGGKILS